MSVGGQAAAIAAVGSKRRVVYAPLEKRDLRIETHFYIRLAQDIAADRAGQEIAVEAPTGSAGTAFPTATATFDPARCSPAIHVNQEGYVPSLPKKAMIGYYLGDMGELDIPPAVVRIRDR